MTSKLRSTPRERVPASQSRACFSWVRRRRWLSDYSRGGLYGLVSLLLLESGTCSSLLRKEERAPANSIRRQPDHPWPDLLAVLLLLRPESSGLLLPLGPQSHKMLIKSQVSMTHGFVSSPHAAGSPWGESQVGDPDILDHWFIGPGIPGESAPKHLQESSSCPGPGIVTPRTS